MKTTLSIILVISIACCLLPSSHAATFDEKAVIRALVDVVEPCIARRDTKSPLFHGCVDWHSSVYGHWAVLWGAKMLNDQALAQRILSRFTEESIKAESELLKQQSTFELPYGRAWLLLLARDAEILYNIKTLRPIAERAYRSLLQFADANGGDVSAVDFKNASWYLYHVYQWAKFVKDEPTQAKIRRLMQQRFKQDIVWLSHARVTGFLNPQDMAVLLFATVGVSAEKWQKLTNSYENDPLQPFSMPFRTTLQGGLNFSRAWALYALYAKTGTEKYREAYQKHISVMVDNLPKWSGGGDYARYAYWVGQFGLFALRIREDFK